ncbi:MAG: ABC transporter ATP-binding protein [Acidimicrobiales bacterium]
MTVPERPSPQPEPGGGAGVEVRDLTRRYGDGPAAITALDGVSVSVRGSEAVAVMGPSGSGKSTLLHLIGAMDKPSGGTIWVGDTAVHELTRAASPDYRRKVGFVFQRFHLLSALSALDNVLAPLLPLHLRPDPEPKGRRLLERVGLAGRERAVPAELSGGEQQRVAIARALVNDPVVVLADEPTGNLDTTTGSEIVSLLLALRAEQGTTLLVATHDPAVASRCDRVVRLADGRIATRARQPEELG